MKNLEPRLGKLKLNEMTIARIFSGMVFLVALFSVFSYVRPYERLGFDTHAYLTITEGWAQVMPDGGTRALPSLPVDLGEKENEEIVIRNTLPAVFPVNGPSLFVRSAHQDVVIRIGGEEVYRYVFTAVRNVDKGFPPTQWLVVRLEDSYAGEEIEISLTRKQKDGTATVSEIFLGAKADVIFALMRKSMFPLVCGILLLLFGIVFIVRHMLSPARRELGNRNFYIGATFVLFAAWVFCNTEVRQIFFQNILYVRNLEFMALMLLPVPVVMSLNYSELGRYKQTANLLCMAIFASDLLIMTLAFAGVKNFLEMLWLIYLMITATAVFCAGSFIRIRRTDRELSKALRIMRVSLGLLVFFVVLEALNLVYFGGRHSGVFLSIGVMLYAIGVTIEQSRAQRELVTQAQQATMESRAKSDFLASMSHEIRTPINAVLGMDEMILRESTDPTVLGYATDIKHAGKHLLTLINDILDLSRIESGRMEISEYDYELSPLLEEITELIRISADEKNLKFQAKIQSMLPNRLRGDAARIRQIAINLLNNAVKYTKRGRIVFTVDTISAEEEALLRAKAVVKGEPTQIKQPVYLHLTVRDTGIGIRKEDLPKLFDSFERLDKEHNAGVQGTGLGLPIVSMLVQLMNGCLLVNSVYEVGTQFTVVIPQEKVSGDWFGAFGKRQEAQDAHRETALFTAPEASVLAVDDNAMNRRLLEALLKRTQVRIVTCASGEECLRLVNGEHFDLILMDHLMPEMDGVETLHRLRSLPSSKCPGVPVVVLTANAVVGAREGYLAEGFTDYLSKPVQSAELEQMLMRCLPKELVLSGGEEQREPDDAPDAESLLPEWLHSVQEIDVPQGLKFCATEEIYLETLAIYARNAASAADEIDTLRAVGDTANVVVKVHALKSTSRAIGAESLGALAEKLELAGKAGDTQTLYGGLDELLSRCHALGGQLATLAADEPAEGKELPEISEEQLRETYGRIRALSEEFEYDRAASMIDSLGAFRLPENERERFERLKAAAEGFDWDKLAEILP